MASDLYSAAFVLAKNEGKSAAEIRAYAVAEREKCLGSAKRITRASLGSSKIIDGML